MTRTIVLERFEDQGDRVLMFGTDKVTGEQVSFHLTKAAAKGPMLQLAAGNTVMFTLPGGTRQRPALS